MTTREIVRDVALVVGGICVGSGMTFILTKRHLEQKWIAIVEEEVDKTEKHYRIVRKAEEAEERALKQLNETRGYSEQDVIDAVGENTILDEAAEAIETYSGDRATIQPGPYWGVPKRIEVDDTVDKGRATVEDIIANASKQLAEDMDADDAPDEEEERTRNVFEDDEADQVPPRDPNSDTPYVVTIDQHFEDDNRYEKITVTFYEADGVLADERDQMVEDQDGTIGRDFDLHWGEGSKDPNIVYIRNDRTEADYEVIRDKRSYHVHVLGMAVDPRSVKKRPQRMRDDE
jgi:hypothetical protein